MAKQGMKRAEQQGEQTYFGSPPVVPAASCATAAYGCVLVSVPYKTDVRFKDEAGEGGEFDYAYASDHLEIGRMDIRYAKALVRIHEGLLRDNRRMRDGSVVASRADAVKYLLDAIIEQTEPTERAEMFR
jgi:hypothetical protein